MIIGSLHGIRRPDPMDRGLCSRISDPDTFLSDDAGDVKEAKLMCAGCPVRQKCLNTALQKSRLPGVWGGLTELERRAVRHGRRSLVDTFDCRHCGRAFMPRRSDSSFCTSDCYKESLKTFKSLVGGANPHGKIKMLAKTG